MPARVVQSAASLGIKSYEHQALVEIRELFATGIFKHDPDVEILSPDGFNMNVVEEETECGTTCCIGGWMFLAMKRNRTAPCSRSADYVCDLRSRALRPLFFPFIDHNGDELLDEDGKRYDFPFDLMPPAFALAAIDNFFATGEPNWPEVVGF